MTDRHTGPDSTSQHLSHSPADTLDYVAPQSSSQQRLWFLAQYEGCGSTYNIPAAFRLTGPLDVEALSWALNAVVARHEALRTTFGTQDGVPVQRIASSLTLSIPVQDLTSVAAAQREQRLRELLGEEVGTPFDLARGPLLRAGLLRLGAQEHVLLLTMHHIVSDGWSLGVLWRELSVLYAASANGTEVSLPELPIQYADYAVWQREQMQGERLASELDYWRTQLADVPVLALPTDRPRPAQQRFEGARQRVALPAQLSAGLTALARDHRTSLYMLLLAALQVLLGRYSGQSDIAVGSPIAGRLRAETRRLIGFFVNTLVLRTDLSGNPSFIEQLGRVREVCLDAYEHQALPFERLVEALNPARDTSRQPLFDVMFVLQNTPGAALSLPQVRVAALDCERTTAKFDLLLSLTETDEGLHGALEYNTDLFDAATVARMVGHFETLLAGIVAQPEARLSELALLTPAERRQLLIEWNDTAVDYPRERCVHALFEAQVEETPEAVAVVYEDAQLSYAELNARANQLAHHLRALGVGPEVLVGLCVERSLAMVVGVLGILKAGGAYVPLDPDYPRERLAFMLEDTQAPVLVTQHSLLERLPDFAGQVVRLDTDWSDIAAKPDTHLPGQATAQNLAYVIYTSGSTGRPKGVAQRHQTLSNLVSWQTADSASCAGARTLQFAPLGFDVSAQEVFSTLVAGGTLVLVSEWLRRDLAQLLRFVNDSRIERLFVPFSALRELANVVDTRRTPVLRTVTEIITAGEQLQVSAATARVFASMPGCVLSNQYGPTETHVVTRYRLPAPPDSWPALPPVGRPIANARIYILDRYSNPVPIGVPGELCLGGDGLARGYLNRPELTAEKFVPNPFSDHPGARLYRTGDLARYRPDGNIEFLGRMDDQVKIRGFRIELGEVESVLGEVESVQACVVVAREDAPGNRRLAAYVVPVAGQAPTATELRRLLAEKLPEYMLPSAFMFLDELPLTPSGKVDRGALPEPVLQTGPGTGYVPPRTSIEAALVAIWREVLGVERVGANDNFFELGGHSLLAVQVLSHTSRLLGVRPTLRELFDAPTVAGFADAVVRSAGDGRAEADLPIRRLRRTVLARYGGRQES